MNAINPFSNSYHALNDFSKLSARQTAAVVIVTSLVALVTLPLLALPAVAVFRGLVGNFSNETGNKVNDFITTKSDSLLNVSKNKLSKADNKQYNFTVQFNNKKHANLIHASPTEIVASTTDLVTPKRDSLLNDPKDKPSNADPLNNRKQTDPTSTEPTPTTHVAIVAPATVITKPFIESPELTNMNHQILTLRTEIESLTEELFKKGISSQRAGEIKNRKAELVHEHTQLMQKKVEFVKTHFPDNPVYALAIPQTLKQGLQVSSAAKKDKIEALKKNGILFDTTKPATGLDPNAPKGTWGVNELGDRGIYFSKGEPAYLGDDLPLAMGCVLTQDVSGVSLLPISTLSKAFGFTDEQINKGYDQIQKEFTFLQHDGVYPSDTEIVFIKNPNVLTITHQFSTNRNGNVVKKPETGVLHSSWK